MIFAGLDTTHRSVCVLDASGQLVHGVRLREGWCGLRQLHGLLADPGGDACAVVLGVEQHRGQREPLVDLLSGAGYRLFGLSDSTVDLCRLLRSAVEGSEPSRAAVIAGLVRSLHHGLQPLSASATLAGYARHHRQLAWDRRYERQLLRGLLARPTASGLWPQDADLDQPGGLQRLVETLGRGGRAGGDRVGACLARLTALELHLDELERRLVEARSPHGIGGYEGWGRGTAEGARSHGPGSSRARRGRGRLAAAAILGLSLGLVAPDTRVRGAGALAPPPPGRVDSKSEGGSGLWLGEESIRTKHHGAQTGAAGSDRPAARLRPVGVEIPAIDLVTPPLVDLGLDPDGGLEVPVDFARAGWYAASAVPGNPGPAVIVGHYDSRRGPAVFYRLAELAPGDAVVVRRSDAVLVTFLVERVARYPKDGFPTEEVYGPTGGPTLRLITCGGRFDRDTGHYEDNLVLFASQTPS